jgi:hypothetical protein
VLLEIETEIITGGAGLTASGRKRSLELEHGFVVIMMRDISCNSRVVQMMYGTSSSSEEKEDKDDSDDSDECQMTKVEDESCLQW